MFKHLTIKPLTVFVLLFIVKLTLTHDIFPGVRQGIINLFFIDNPTSTSTSAIAKRSYASSSEGDHTSKRPKN